MALSELVDYEFAMSRKYLFLGEKLMDHPVSPKRRSATPYGTTTDSNILRRTPLDFGAIFGVLFLLTLTVGAISWQFWHVNRIYHGVTVANVAVGGMTRAEALVELGRQLPTYPMPALTLTQGDQQWPLQQGAFQSSPDFLSAVNEAYLVGRQRPFLERLGEQIIALTGGVNVRPSLRYDQTQLQQVVFAVADEAEQPGRPARQLGDLSIPAEPGILVDVGATTSNLIAALASATTTAIEVPLVVTEFIPQASATVENPAATILTESTTTGSLTSMPLGFSPLRLIDQRYGIELALDPILLGKVVPSGDPTQMDADALRGYLFNLAAQLDVAPRDARLRFNPATGGVTVLQESHSGRQLDIGATIDSIQEVLVNGSTQATLVLREVPATVDMNRVAEMGIRELVASGVSYFRGSSVARVRNIEVAAEKFDGLVIPPGEIFSFNAGVEDVTAANGFEDSLVILGDTTAVGVGGGVCQVSTTIFRAAYNAGFPIVERYNHGYVVSWYGDPGLDATIYTPTVDFRFRNDTGAYLLIEPVVDNIGGVITFNLYGTKPDRVVTVGLPQRSNVIEPEPPTYVINEALAPGQRKQVEWEQTGMTVTVERTIVENGTTRTDTLTSVYQPWQAVYEVGPGTEIPATPTPAVASGLLDPNIAITPTPSSPRTGP